MKYIIICVLNNRFFGEIKMTENASYIADFLGCECEFFDCNDNSDIIESRFNELLTSSSQSSVYPLIIVVSSEFADMLKKFVICNNVEDIPAYRRSKISEAECFNGADWLKKKFAFYAKLHHEDNLMGSSQEFEPAKRLFSFKSEHISCEGIIIAKIPADNPWELACWLPLGEFIDGPNVVQQIAVFKYWHEKYDVVPAVVTHGSWELKIGNPPIDDESSEQAAKGHFAFCYNVVVQAPPWWNCLRARASVIKGSSSWFFWWD